MTSPPRSQPDIAIDTDSPEGNAMAEELSGYTTAHGKAAARNTELPSSPDAPRPVVATHPVPEGAAEDAPPAIQRCDVQSVEKAIALLRWGTWYMTPAAQLDWKNRVEEFLSSAVPSTERL